LLGLQIFDQYGGKKLELAFSEGYSWDVESISAIISSFILRSSPAISLKVEQLKCSSPTQVLSSAEHGIIFLTGYAWQYLTTTSSKNGHFT
jgi:hypothetical protein